MITGAHMLLYSTDPEADRAFFRDVLGFRNVDSGGGWLIFKLPPAELAIHPTDEEPSHELYLMCNDIEKTVEELRTKGVTCSEIVKQRWGLLTSFPLPSGSLVQMYEPLHPKAIDL